MKNRGESHLTIIRTLLSRLSILGETAHSEKMEQAEDMQQKAYDFNPDDVAPEEIQGFLWHILEWRDTFFKDVSMGIEKIPGLSTLLDEITDALNACEHVCRTFSFPYKTANAELHIVILTMLEPVLKVCIFQHGGLFNMALTLMV